MTKKTPNKSNPIEKIEWIQASKLIANEYNPNHVLPEELRLIELSILQNGWIQPILITKNNVIIDGFHRATIGRLNDWIVPCCILDISEPERMLLTIRINRAKGTHIAFKMAEIIKKLVNDFKLTKDYIANSIGATKKEIELLLQEDVFKKLDIANHTYSKAWQVKNK
ncbi:MAG: ParB/RepB/Spo0J family partition protein [Raineya sp.]